MDPFKTLIIGTPPSRTYTGDATGLLTAANNLSDVADAQTALNNLGAGTNLNLTGATSTITLGAATEIATLAVDASGGLTVTPKAGQAVTVASNLASKTLLATVAAGGTSAILTDGTNSTVKVVHEAGVAKFNNGADQTWLSVNGITPTFAGNLTASGTGSHVFGTTNTVTLASGAVTATKDIGVIDITSSTGTNQVQLRLNNTGGAYYYGAENSAGTNFGATAYAQVVFAPSGRNIEFFPNATKALTLATTGNATFAGSATITGGIVGTTTNDSAAAGKVGEYVESVIAAGSAVSLTTATAANVTSISLTAGDWDVSSLVHFSMSGTTATVFAFGPHTVSANLPATDYVGDLRSLTGITDTLRLAGQVQRFSLSGTTTIYLVAQSSFSAGTVAAYGTIRARRVR